MSDTNGSVVKLGPKRMRRNPTRGYRPQGFSGTNPMGYYLTGEPWFSWQYVPVMQRDPAVTFGLMVKTAPLSRVKIEKAKCRNREAAAWAVKTTMRFWQQDLPLMIDDYGCWGRMVGGAEWDVDHDTGRLELQQVRRIDPTECQPRVWASGCNKGEFAGYTLSNSSVASRFVAAPNAFWFAGRQRLSVFADLPTIAGAFTPWLEKTSAGGARQTRRLFYWRDAVGVNVIYYPVGSTKRNGVLVNNEDAARQTVEMLMNGSAVTMPNTPAPDGKDKAWQIDQRQSKSDNAGVRDYPKDLDAEIWMGEGVPQEVIRAMDSGSGFAGRSIPYEVYLGDNDTLAGMIFRTFKAQVLDYGLRANFGTTSVELELTNLVEQFRRENGQSNPGRSPEQGGDQQQQQRQPDRRPEPIDLSGLRVMDAVRRKNGTAAQRRERLSLRALALAMLRLKEFARNSGDPARFDEQIDSLAGMADDPEEVAKALGSVSLAWVEYGQSRSGKTRWRDSDTGAVRYQKSRPGEHTERREKSHASAKAAEGIIRSARNGTATAADLDQLATHIHAMNYRHLRTARRGLEATFRNATRREQMVQALINHVGGIQPKPAAPKGGGSLADAVKKFGGIDPSDSEFKAHFSNVAEAREYGISLGVFRKGGAGFDQMAERLRDAGHLTVPEHQNATDALAEALRSKAKSDLADREREYEDAYRAYYAAKQEAENREGDKRGRKKKGAAGDTAGKAGQGEEGAGQNAGGGQGGGKTDFNFGFNLTPREDVGKVDPEKVAFKPHPRQRGNPKAWATVMIDPTKLDAEWRHDDPQSYVPPGGGGAEIKGRRAGVVAHLSKGEPLEAPNVMFGKNGVHFADGRHRFSVLMDSGAHQVAVTVPRGQAKKFLRKFGVEQPVQLSTVGELVKLVPATAE